MGVRTTEAQKAAHAARMRAWRRLHPDLERARQQENYRKHHEARLAAQLIRNRTARAALKATKAQAT